MDPVASGHRSSLIRAASRLQESLADLLRTVQEINRARAERSGVSASQSQALLLLLKEGPLTVGHLGKGLCLDKSTASRLAKGLLKKELIRKRSPASDERKVILQITERGLRVTRRLQNELSEDYLELLLRLEPETRETLPTALGELGLELRQQMGRR